MSKKLLLAIGVINLLHGLMHLFQFVQSALLVSYSLNKKESWIHELFEHPLFGLFWAVIGIITIFIGYKDYKHHKKHKECETH